MIPRLSLVIGSTHIQEVDRYVKYTQVFMNVKWYELTDL